MDRRCTVQHYHSTGWIDVAQSCTFPLGKVAQHACVMCSPSTIQHFSVRKSGTIRRRCGVIRLRRNCVISSFYIKYIALPQSSTFPLGKVARYAKGVALPPLNKGRCFILLRMKRRGESLISPAPDRGGRRRAAAAPGPGCRLPATAKTAGGGRAVRGCPRGWKPADKHRY